MEKSISSMGLREQHKDRFAQNSHALYLGSSLSVATIKQWGLFFKSEIDMK